MIALPVVFALSVRFPLSKQCEVPVVASKGSGSRCHSGLRNCHGLRSVRFPLSTQCAVPVTVTVVFTHCGVPVVAT
jgi:hypothetical protein